MTEALVLERKKNAETEYLVAPTTDYIAAPIRELRNSENLSGVEYLLLTLGEENIKKLFGYSDEELQVALKIQSHKLFDRQLSNEEIQKKFKTSMWRVFNLERERERFAEVCSGRRFMFNEIAEGLENSKTTFSEYAWGKNTNFCYKVIRHPNPPEDSQKFKIVMYVPDLHEGESWEDAWRREDFRVSTEKFIKAKSASDPKYSSNFDNLRVRDELEKKLMNVLVSKAEDIFSSDEPSIILSVSPSPPASRYARKMGYGVTWFKKLSHTRVYAASRMDEQTVLLDGTTVFTYRPKWRLRKLMMESSTENSLNSEAVKQLGIFSNHVDILSVPVEIKNGDGDSRKIVERIDQNLNNDTYLFDYLSYFSYSATKWHRSVRLQSKEVADKLFGDLSKEYMWRYYCILASGQGVEVEMLLKENLILMSEKSERMYAKYMTDQEEAKSGRKFSVKEREKVENAFVNATRERIKGGLCPTVSKSKRFKLNEKGEIVEDDDENTSLKDCLIECRGKIVDYFQKVIKNCCWSAKAERDVTYHSCPECGWYPGKPDILVDESVFVDTKKIDRTDDIQLKKYFEIVTPDVDGEYDDLVERSRVPHGSREFMDFENSEVVYMIGFISIRRRVSVSVLEIYSNGLKS